LKYLNNKFTCCTDDCDCGFPVPCNGHEIA
jgi:hypothetical protein